MLVGLISLFFILLAVFMISNSLVSLPGTTVKLPKMNQLEPPKTTQKLIVTVTKDAEIFFNGSRMDWTVFRQKLSERVQHNIQATANAMNKPAGVVSSAESSMIVVFADQSITLETWFRIADIAREFGLDSYLVTEPPPKPQPALTEPTHASPAVPN